MAYVNVKEWSVEQVMYWLKGLDNVIFQYQACFLNNGVTGHQLLNFRADDLDNLGVKKLGHQEIILEAVEHLRNFHYELDKENLQMLALKLSCAANSLYKELLLIDEKSDFLKTQVMSDVHNIVAAIKPLVLWLDRSPFTKEKDYIENKKELLSLSFDMAYIAHRGIFSENPVLTIKKNCDKLAKIADYIIQEICDPMVLQPASLDLATLKKKEQDLGFYIMPNYHPIHQIVDIKFGTPAHGSTKIEEGDEIVQINYQTVVGWQAKKVMLLLQEVSPEVVLTLKKRPRHSKVYGQIYMKPYRLPSRKKSTENWSKWNDNMQSPRLLPIINLPPITVTKSEEEISNVEAELSSSDSEPPDSPLEGNFRMYPVKPRPILQRRNTITGTTPTNKRPTTSIEEYWDLIQSRTKTNHRQYHIEGSKFVEEDSRFLRDKSQSCNVGLDSSPRPTTVIGLTHKSFRQSFKSKKKVNFEEEMRTKLQKTNLNDEKSLSINSLSSVHDENISYIDEGKELTDRSNMVASSPLIKDPNLADINVHSIIKKFDEPKKVSPPKPRVLPRSIMGKKEPPEVPQKPAVPPRAATTKLRGRLDKSHSTPAYDLTEEEPEVDHSPIKLNPKLDKLPDVIPKIPETITETSPTAPDSPKNFTFSPLTSLATKEVFKPPPEASPPKPETLSAMEDLPPKPPPRKSLDNSKPDYPANTPKPAITPAQNKIFEFPEANVDPKRVGSVQSIKSVDSNDYLVPVQVRQPKKHSFEPKGCSTPVGKLRDYSEIDVGNRSGECKVSPTNSIVKAMISSKGRSAKKKNSLVAKRRKVTVNDLNPSDIQGFLYQRFRNRHNQNVHWEQRYFVLMGNCLYGFKLKEDPRAACLIFLHDFTVAVASEVKSRTNAFKVYHTGTVFYFSAEDPDTLQMWLDLIRPACLQTDPTTKVFESKPYSESDDSDSEKPRLSQSEKSDSLKKFGSLKKFSLRKSSEASNTSSSSLDRKWFFNKSAGGSGAGGNQKSNVPIPTAQFRSYRKIRNEPTHASVRTGNFTSHVPMFGKPSNLIATQTQNSSVPNLTVVEQILRVPTVLETSKHQSKIFVHASNLSLASSAGASEYTSTSIKVAKEYKSGNDNGLTGFVTLEELMIRQSEESRKNPHNEFDNLPQINLNLIKPDVVYGEIPIRTKLVTPEDVAESETCSLTRSSSQSEKHESSSSCFGKRLGSLKRNQKLDEGAKISATYPKMESKTNRSLPRMLKMQESTRDCDEYTLSNVHYSSDRNLISASRKKSYEMIYCPETVNESQFAQNRMIDDAMSYETSTKKSSKIKRQTSFGSSFEKKSSKSLPGFTSRVGDSSRARLKSAIQYTPITLPMTPDNKSGPKFAFELNLDEKQTKSGGKLSKIFSGKSEKKEKTFLGSPKLHRAIFRRQQSGPEASWAASISQRFGFGDDAAPKTDTLRSALTRRAPLGAKKKSQTQTKTQAASPGPQNQNAKDQPLPICLSTSTSSLDQSLMRLPPPAPSQPQISVRPHVDYPGLTYPPVFEPETYSLADPQKNINLLRNRQKND